MKKKIMMTGNMMTNEINDYQAWFEESLLLWEARVKERKRMDILEGKKDDHGKAPLWINPREAVEALAFTLAHGAQKYGLHNFRRGLSWSRLVSAGLRHFTAWANGESKDLDSKFSHLWHAMACAAILIVYEARGLGVDDRGLDDQGNPR